MAKRRHKRKINPNVKKARNIVWGLQHISSTQPHELMRAADINLNQASRILSLEGHYFGPGGLGEERYIKKVTSILNQ